MSNFSIKTELLKSASNTEQLFNFLIDFKNFNQILPEDKAENFVFDADKCSFNIKGITPMEIHLQEKIPFSKIVFRSKGLAKFDFLLTVFFEADNFNKIELSGSMNPFIFKMAEKPLTALVVSMNKKLSELKLNPHEN